MADTAPVHILRVGGEWWAFEAGGGYVSAFDHEPSDDELQQLCVRYVRAPEDPSR